MNIYKVIILISFVLATFTSCFKERITPNYNTGANKKIVINAWINTLDEPQFVQVSETVNYLGSFTPSQISNAIVSIEDEVTTYDLIEREPGFYYLSNDWTPQIGNTYHLSVRYDGKEYTATHQMNPCPDIENLDYDFFETIDSIDWYEAFFSFQEISGKGDAYYGTSYKKGSLSGDSLTNGGFIDDAFIDGEYLSDIYIDGAGFQEGDTAVVELYSIGLETANYLQDIETEIYRGSPFDPPPANVRTNLTGGAVGYFIVSDAKAQSIVVE